MNDDNDIIELVEKMENPHELSHRLCVHDGTVYYVHPYDCVRGKLVNLIPVNGNESVLVLLSEVKMSGAKVFFNEDGDFSHIEPEEKEST